MRRSEYIIFVLDGARIQLIDQVMKCDDECKGNINACNFVHKSGHTNSLVFSNLLLYGLVLGDLNHGIGSVENFEIWKSAQQIPND